MNAGFDPFDLITKHGADRIELGLDKAECEEDLAVFFRRAWPAFDPAAYQHNWHIDAICLPYETPILTEIGPQAIGHVVESGWEGHVLSFNHDARTLEWQPIAKRMKSPASLAVRIVFADGKSLTITGNHPVFVKGVGYVRADRVVASQTVLRALPSLRDGILSESGSDETRSAVLQPTVFRTIENSDRAAYLRDVRRAEDVAQGRWWLPRLLRQIQAQWRNTTVSTLPEAGLSERSKLGCVIAKVRRFLQSCVSRCVQSRVEQSSLSRWFGASSLPGRVLSYAEGHQEARRAPVPVMSKGGASGSAPSGPQSGEQRSAKPGVALSKMPRRPECSDASRDYETGECTVVAVEREIRLSAPVYNIEVGRNHNYFAEGILVHNCDHLMAVADGQIRRLLINVPPRCSKTLLCTVAFPAWLWALPTNLEYPLHGAGLRLLCVAYGTTRAKEDAVTSRNLIASEWYQQRWGHQVRIAANRDNSERFDTIVGGSRISVGIEASVLGRGGNLKIIDDAMKPDDPESELARQGVIRSYDETLSNRENDPRLASEIIVAQRLGELDLPGHVLTKYGSDPDNGGFCHLMIPAEYDSGRHCVTVLGWQDPRGCKTDKSGNKVMLPDAIRKMRDGESFWPERFSADVLDQRKTAEGPYSWASKYQQSPSPRGGGIIKGEWWKLWQGDSFPDFRLVVVSVDTAQTEKEINDESGITVWGVFDGDRGYPQLMLVYAWEGHLEFFQLVSKVTDCCRGIYNDKAKTGPKTDVCLVEGKNNGIDVINEMKRLHGKREWSTIQINPVGDKVSRLKSQQAAWSGEFKRDPITHEGSWQGGIVYAPDKDFADLTITRVGTFPNSPRKGIVDTASQAVKWLRDNGHILTPEEHQDDIDEEMAYKPPRKPLYDV